MCKQSLSDPGGNRPSFSSPPRLSSSSSGPLPTTARKYTGEHQSTDTIAEELEDYTAEDEPNGISHVGHGGGLGGDETGGVQEPQDSLDRYVCRNLFRVMWNDVESARGPGRNTS